MELRRESGTRRVYAHANGALTVEVCTTEHSVRESGLMSRWVKRGYLPEFIPRTLSVQTYFDLPGGTQSGGPFNPTAKHGKVDFDWMLEATPENERLLLDEVQRRFDEWLDEITEDTR